MELVVTRIRTQECQECFRWEMYPKSSWRLELRCRHAKGLERQSIPINMKMVCLRTAWHIIPEVTIETFAFIWDVQLFNCSFIQTTAQKRGSWLVRVLTCGACCHSSLLSHIIIYIIVIIKFSFNQNIRNICRHQV